VKQARFANARFGHDSDDLEPAPPSPGDGDGRVADHSIRITSERPLADVPDEERKTVTALFADIKGSMDLMEELDIAREQCRGLLKIGVGETFSDAGDNRGPTNLDNPR
jgi:class 3 adenylate cyclase